VENRGSGLYLNLCIGGNPGKYYTVDKMSKRKIHWTIKMWASIVSITSIVLVIISFFWPNKERPEFLIISLIIIAIGIPLLMLHEFSELDLFGFKFKVWDKVQAIEKRQLSNQVVTTTYDNSTQQWFWFNESGEANRIPDRETAEFLSKDKGILKEDLKCIDVKGQLPSFKNTASAKHHERHVFILYNGTLYYQSGLSWLYRLASLNSIDFQKMDFKDWKDNNGDKWVKEVSAEDFVNNKLV
jgi:hypothetical protein